MEFPTELYYTSDHEWIKIEDNIGTIGITDFAQSELGDIVYVDIPNEGKTLLANDVFGTIEAVKTVSDLFMPMTGEIIEVNPNLESTPEKVNTDPYKSGWLIKIKLDNKTSVNDLLDAEAYKKHTGIEDE